VGNIMVFPYAGKLGNRSGAGLHSPTECEEFEHANHRPHHLDGIVDRFGRTDLRRQPDRVRRTALVGLRTGFPFPASVRAHLGVVPAVVAVPAPLSVGSGLWCVCRVERDVPCTASATRVLLANVNAANRDYPKMRRAILKYEPDFIVLLEVTPWLLERLTEFDGRYPHRAVAPREDNFGIALLGRQPFLRTEIMQFGAAELPSITAEIAVGERRLILVGTHPLPPVSAEAAQNRNEQLAALALFARQAWHPLLLLGDLNVSPWSPYFARLLTDSGLRDSADGPGILPSWPVGLAPLWIPIDHALYSDGVEILRRETGPTLGSDHYPVIVDFYLARS
jgi:endonuclease/exonuclease/phosphatase (EEP) superfamily protein YafD